MITREADYAIRAVLYLAAKGDTGLVATNELADEMLVPYRFLRRIVQKLVEGGLVVTHRGKGGGLRLARRPDEITLVDVLRIADSKALYLNSCLTNGHAICPRAPFCTVRPQLRAVQDQLGCALDGLTFAMLAQSMTVPAPAAEG